VLALIVLSSALFAAIYVPAITRFSRSLASPYAKADVGRRIAAGAIDGLLVVTCVGFYTDLQSPLFLAAGAAYLLLRDGVGGQSVGKFLFSLTVIRLTSGRPCNFSGSAQRNLVFLIPGANIVAVFLEALTIRRDPLGQRLGDRIAQTQVVESLGAREVIKALQLRRRPEPRLQRSPSLPCLRSSTARDSRPCGRGRSIVFNADSEDGRPSFGKSGTAGIRKSWLSA
jgi:uncharacterized RDD family membrane protein YckC